MKTYTPDALAALEGGDCVSAGAIAILAPGGEVYWWTGHGELVIDGHTFIGIGQHGLITVTGGTLGGAAESIELVLSGVDPAVLDLVDLAQYRRAPFVLWRLIFDSAGTNLLGANVHRRGRLDQLIREDVAGGVAAVKAMVEGAARGAGRGLVRMRADSDQRLAEGTDGGFKHVSFAGEKKLNLGGEAPRSARGGALPGASLDLPDHLRPYRGMTTYT